MCLLSDQGRFCRGQADGKPGNGSKKFLKAGYTSSRWLVGRGSMCGLVSNTARLDCNSVPLFISCPQDDDQRDGTTLCDVVTSKHRHRVCILIRKMVKLFSAAIMHTRTLADARTHAHKHTRAHVQIHSTRPQNARKPRNTQYTQNTHTRTSHTHAH